MELKAYCQNKLLKECQEIKASERNVLHPELNLYEKALIYKYSSDGYVELNKKLRSSKGKNSTDFGKLLANALEKIDNYTSTVYRKVQLTKTQQKVYKEALHNNSFVKEPTFSSTSKVRDLAMLFPGNTLFIINSKTGKDIEKITKFGYKDVHNEYEVLFLPNRKFEVLEFDNHNNGRNLIL